MKKCKSKPEKEYHCWNCNGKLDSVKEERDGTIVGTCWHCNKDDVSAIENEKEEGENEPD